MANSTGVRDAERSVTADRVLTLTRVVAALVLPFLLAAFVILYLFSESTGRWFAWQLGSPLTAAIMGGGYLAGAYFFTRVLLTPRWHRVGSGFPPVAIFTLMMLIATLLHWDTFDPGHWPFLVWLALYIITPVLIPVVWWLNRQTDDGAPEPDDFLLPPAVGPAMLLVGLALLATALALLIAPSAAASVLPWPQTPLTARVLAGWQAMLAAGALTLGFEPRWSGWRIPFQSILLWQGLILLAAVWHRDEFGAAGLGNWFVLYTLLGVLAGGVVYLLVEWQRRRP